jgi:hypothetical protein
LYFFFFFFLLTKLSKNLYLTTGLQNRNHLALDSRGDPCYTQTDTGERESDQIKGRAKRRIGPELGRI